MAAGTGLVDPAEVDLSVDIAGVRFPTPVMTASGCAAATSQMLSAGRRSTSA